MTNAIDWDHPILVKEVDSDMLVEVFPIRFDEDRKAFFVTTRSWIQFRVMSFIDVSTFRHYPAKALSDSQKRRLIHRMGASTHKECEFLEGMDCVVYG